MKGLWRNFYSVICPEHHHTVIWMNCIFRLGNSVFLTKIANLFYAAASAFYKASPKECVCNIRIMR